MRLSLLAPLSLHCLGFAPTAGAQFADDDTLTSLNGAVSIELFDVNADGLTDLVLGGKYRALWLESLKQNGWFNAPQLISNIYFNIRKYSWST